MLQPPNKIETIFFDMGSTLVGIKPSWEGIYHQVFQKAGYDLPLGEVEQAVAYSWNIVGSQDATAEYTATLEANRLWQLEVEKRVMARLKIEPHIHEELFWKIIEAFEHEESYALYPETLNVLEGLKAKGYRLGIISNWGWHLPELCEKLAIAGFFDYIATSARVGYPKPRPEIFRHALTKMSAQPETSLHIGDTWSADVEGARGVGIFGLWLDRPNNQLYPPDTGLQNPARQPVRIETLKDVWKFL
jgi:putative hydrolase of the HAD superfamily